VRIEGDVLFPTKEMAPGHPRSVLTGETMREMSKADRVIGVRSPTNNDAQKTSLALKEDFKKLQQINNQMMATVWAHDQVDYDSVCKRCRALIASPFDCETD
jgi:hypothetical protein